MEKIKDNKSGSSLVSVIVAFAILMIAISMMYTATVTSMNLIVKAKKTDEEATKLLETFYSQYQGTTTDSGSWIQLTPISTGTGFEVTGKLETTGTDTGTGFYYYQIPEAPASSN